jgi:peptide/nickel transport system substrate-binding protein
VFGSIDPILAATPAPGVTAFRVTCAGLMTRPAKRFPAGLQLVPEIAADHPRITNGGKTYIFKIRKGVRFSDGSPVRARSFVHTINRQLDPRMKSPYAIDYRNIVGAQAVIEGTTTKASGVEARGSTLIIRLTKPDGRFLALAAGLCVVPESMPIRPEGARAPVPGAGPYYIAEYVPGRRVLLERNPYYRGDRPRHVDRFEIRISGDEATAIALVERGELDYAWTLAAAYAGRAEEFRRKYGINRARFFLSPALNLRILYLNTERPLFRNNVKLRQAVNFAVDRRAMMREISPLGGHPNDQYLAPFLPGFRNERIYPLKGPDLKRARELAKGNTRSGKAVLYVHDRADTIALGQIVKQNLKLIGIEVEIVANPVPLHFEKLGTRGEPFDIGFTGWIGVDETILNNVFDGRTIGQPGNRNWSYFDSPTYNRLLARVSRMPPGPERIRAYSELDAKLARSVAPAVAVGYDGTLNLVSKRTGCVVVNPYLDLAAVCLK